MTTFLLALLLVQERPELRTEFRPLAEGGKERAVVLLHGLLPHPFSEKKANAPVSPSWQAADSRLGKALRAHGSLFAFSYSQNRPVEEIPRVLLPHVKKLRKDGFKEIVLVGFSAGALVSRQFVEDHPDAGVHRVVQVCPPNAGSDWGKLARTVRGSQEVFVASMKEEVREKFLADRAERGVRIPDTVEFVVVMASVAGNGDTVVRGESAWPRGLRAQGIPVEPVRAVHSLAMRSKTCVKIIARLASTPQPRWSPERVKAAEKEIFD